MSIEGAGSVLVVDDNPYVLDITESLLKSIDFEIISCTDPEDAVGKVSEADFDVVLSDIIMPKLKGTELLKKVHEINSDIPVILMTAYAELDMAVNAVKNGAFDFIIKPYKPEQLTHAIKKAANYHRLVRREKDHKRTLEAEVAKRTQELADALGLVTMMSNEVVERLVRISEFRDTDTGEHIKRIGLYSRKIAERLGMDKDFIEAISFASSMHDIGKIGIPDSILLKPGSLTGSEFETMKRHTVIGSQMLAGSSYPSITMAGRIALNHHERFDGTGYPAGLKGKEIPLEARIVMLVDQYDALRSRRPYKSSFPHKDAMEIILNGDGRTMPSHFDPEVLKAFTDLEASLNMIYEENKDNIIACA